MGRFAAMKGVTLEFNSPADHIEIFISPFLLENILYVCIDYAMEATGSAKKVEMDINKILGGAEINFSGLELMAEIENGVFGSEEEKKLLNTLGGQINVDVTSGTLILRLPGENV